MLPLNSVARSEQDMAKKKTVKWMMCEIDIKLMCTWNV